TPSRSAAVTVTSVASSGRLHNSRNETFERNARYSGMYRPACLINQTGVTSDASQRQAFRNGLPRRDSEIGHRPVVPDTLMGSAMSPFAGLRVRKKAYYTRPQTARNGAGVHFRSIPRRSRAIPLRFGGLAR